MRSCLGTQVIVLPEKVVDFFVAWNTKTACCKMMWTRKTLKGGVRGEKTYARGADVREIDHISP